MEENSLFTVELHSRFSERGEGWEAIAWTVRRTTADDLAAVYLARDSIFDRARIWHQRELVAQYNQLSRPGVPVQVTVAQIGAYLKACRFTSGTPGEAGVLWTSADGHVRIGVPHDDSDTDLVAGAIERIAANEGVTFGELVAWIVQGEGPHPR